MKGDRMGFWTAMQLLVYAFAGDRENTLYWLIRARPDERRCAKKAAQLIIELSDKATDVVCETA